MEASQLNPLIVPQVDDALIVGRYVEGQFTPFRWSLGDLIRLVNNPNTLPINATTVALESNSYNIVSTITAITSSVTGSSVILPLGIQVTQVTVINQSTNSIAVSASPGQSLISNSNSIAAGTAALFFYVGNNTWYY